MTVNELVWHRVLRGETLRGLGLPLKEGRIELRGICAPRPDPKELIRTAIADAMVVETVVVKRATWDSLHFSGCCLDSLRLFDCVIRNCVFDECSCHDWRMWSTAVSDTSFYRTDFRQSALGGTKEGERNSFCRTVFHAADLRQTSYDSAQFVGCTFKDSKLDKVDFQGSTFEDCTFEGDLREVLFHKGGEQFPSNKMSHVDFSRAKLRWVEFRALDLETLQFPQDEEHHVIHDYPHTLDKLLLNLKGREDTASRSLAALLGHMRKWAGQKQTRGRHQQKRLIGNRR